MKMFKLFPASLLLVMFALTFAGCKTPEDTAFKVTGGVVVTVQASYAAYLDWAIATKAPEEQQLLVRRSYDAYYTSMMIEKEAIIAYKDGRNTNGLSIAVAAVVASSADLISLITQLLPPPNVAKLKGIN